MAVDSGDRIVSTDVNTIEDLTKVAADHDAASNHQVVNVCYGTGDAPTASTTTIGSLYVTYTA